MNRQEILTAFKDLLNLAIDHMCQDDENEDQTIKNAITAFAELERNL